MDLMVICTTQKVASKNYTMTKSGSSTNRRACLICIWISYNLSWALVFIDQTFSSGFFNTLQDVSYAEMWIIASQCPLQGKLRNQLSILTTKEIFGRANWDNFAWSLVFCISLGLIVFTMEEYILHINLERLDTILL